MLSYDALIQQLNTAMLAGNDDRVGLLKRVLARLGHPDQDFKIVHIAGTNGKGSTGTLVAHLLQNQGYRVGHFASPALVDQREQIQINDQLISRSVFVATYEKIVPQLPLDVQPSDLTIFEWFTLIMIQAFADAQVDWAVIEAGLGGLTDATNAIEPPLLTIFTHIDLDHTKILGDTIAKIATNKAQIIKPRTTVFMAPHQHDEAIDIIRHTAQAHHAKTCVDDTQIKIQIISEQLTGFDLVLNSQYLVQQKAHLSLIGDFQIDNLTTVLMVYDWLVERHYVDNVQTLLQTLATTKIAGRMQQLLSEPPVIIDGAHNPDSTQQLMRSLGHLFPDRKWIFVIGFLKDKNYAEMVEMYRKFGAQIFITTPANPKRALNQNQLKQLLPEAQIVADAREGLRQALIASDEKSVVVITGSFYLIKELE